MPAVNGKEIRSRRQRTGLRVSEFAVKHGIKPKTLANIESGSQDKKVSIEIVWKLANAFGVEADDLLSEDDDGDRDAA